MVEHHPVFMNKENYGSRSATNNLYRRPKVQFKQEMTQSRSNSAKSFTLILNDKGYCDTKNCRRWTLGSKQNELKNVTQFQSVRKALGMFATKGPSSSAEAFLRLQKVTSRARGLWMPCQAYGS